MDVAANKHIAEFRIRHWPRAVSLPLANAEAMLHLLRQATTSLKTLQLPLDNGSLVAEFCSLFQANMTLRSLFLDNLLQGSAVPVIASLNEHSSIHQLGLGLGAFEGTVTPFDVAEALFALLKAKSKLDCLSLTNFRFDAKFIAHVLDALQGHHTISKLYLINCHLTREAAALVVSYMKERNKTDKRGLKSLYIGGCRLFVPPPPGRVVRRPVNEVKREYFKLHKEWNHGLVQIMLSGQPTTLSALVVESTGFWTALGKSDNSQQSPLLENLRVEPTTRNDTYDNDWKAAIRCIPNLVHLRRLEWEVPSTVTRLNETSHKGALLGALRQNASLYEVRVQRQVGGGRKADVQWTADEKRKIAAYGQRNQHMPRLLGTGGTGTTYKQTRLQQQVAVRGSGAALVPPLFATAQHTPRMTLHQVLLGITALDNAIDGHASGRSVAASKRSAPASGSHGGGHEPHRPSRRRRVAPRSSEA